MSFSDPNSELSNSDVSLPLLQNDNSDIASNGISKESWITASQHPLFNEPGSGDPRSETSEEQDMWAEERQNLMPEDTSSMRSSSMLSVRSDSACS